MRCDVPPEVADTDRSATGHFAIGDFEQPVVVLRLPDERILFASDAARALLAPPGTELTGRTLREFIDGPAGSAIDLLRKAIQASSSAYWNYNTAHSQETPGVMVENRNW